MSIGFEPGSPFALPPALFPALEEIDFDTLTDLAEVTGVSELQLPEQPEDGRVASLEQFVVSAVIKSFLNQFTDVTLTQCKTDLKNLLEPCKAILNPGQKLQFLRHVALQFLSDKTAFFCQFTSQPNQLPAGVALSWVANHPVKVDVANPALRLLLQHVLNPSEYSEHYSVLIEQLLLACAKQDKAETRAMYAVTFGQLHIEYEYGFYLTELLSLFFSAHLEKAQIRYPDLNMSVCCRLLRMEAPYHYSDPRFMGKVTVTHYVFDNLLLAGAISSFVPFFVKVAPDAYLQLQSYVIQMLVSGVIGSQTLLSDQILLSLFSLVSFCKRQIKENMLVVIIDAYQVIAEKNPVLATEIKNCLAIEQQWEGHTIPESYKTARQQFSKIQSKSIIIRDFQLKSGIDPKKQTKAPSGAFQHNMQQPDVVKLLQTFVAAPRPIVISTELAVLNYKAKFFLERGFLAGMHVAWTKAAKRLSSQQLLDQYLIHLGNYIRQKNENHFLDVIVGCAILGLLPLVDEHLLFASAVFWTLIPSQSKGWVTDYIYSLADTANAPEYRVVIASKLRHIIPKTLKWVSSGPKGEACKALLHSLQARLDGDFRNELRAFVPFVTSIGERDKNQHFAEILFCAHLASLWSVPREMQELPDAILDHFLLFTKDQVQVCQDIATYEKVVARTDKKIFCITTKEVHEAFKTKAQLANPLFFMRGLMNKENNCFINASLQALMRVKAFQKLVETPLEKSEPLQQMLRELLENKHPDTAHSQILDFLYTNVADLKTKRGAIHDATPVIEEILDRLKYKQMIQVTYQGLNGKRTLVSKKQNPIFVLQVPLEKKRLMASLQSLIHQAFSKKIIHDEKNQWKAGPEGKEILLSDYSITYSLVEPLADMLVIQLERGYWNQANAVTQASSMHVVFQDPVVIGSCRYVLRACINYHPDHKHYTADVWQNDNWYRCDDTSLQRIQQPATALSYLYFLEKL